MSPEQLLGSVDAGDAVLVADLEAGTGTLTRLGSGAIDVALIVVEPSPRSIDVAVRAAAAARERDAGRLIVVTNRFRPGDDLSTITQALAGVALVIVPDAPAVVAADRQGVAPLDLAPDAPAVQALRSLADRLAARS